jgi:hypothetical protein
MLTCYYTLCNFETTCGSPGTKRGFAQFLAAEAARATLPKMLEWSELKLNNAISAKADSTIAAPEIRFPSIPIF